MRVLINALRKPSLETPGHVTKNLQTENGRKVAILNRYISVITDIDEKWFVVFEQHTINHFSFGYVRLPQLEHL